MIVPVDQQIAIPVVPDVFVNLNVYFEANVAERASRDHLQADVDKWILDHAEPPLAQQIHQFLVSNAISSDVHVRADLPHASMKLLESIGIEPASRAVLDRATHGIAIGTRESVRGPRIGLWSTIATAMGVAVSANGVVIDPALPRVLPRSA